MHWADYLVFSESDTWYIIFNFLINCLCLISSYMYLFMAAFRSDSPEYYPTMWNTMIVFESFFLIYMMMQFFKEYVSEFQLNKPIRDLKQIAALYLDN